MNSIILFTAILTLHTRNYSTPYIYFNVIYNYHVSAKCHKPGGVSAMKSSSQIEIPVTEYYKMFSHAQI